MVVSDHILCFHNKKLVYDPIPRWDVFIKPCNRENPCKIYQINNNNLNLLSAPHLCKKVDLCNDCFKGNAYTEYFYISRVKKT